jgi:hypothetical protein
MPLNPSAQNASLGCPARKRAPSHCETVRIRKIKQLIPDNLSNRKLGEKNTEFFAA